MNLNVVRILISILLIIGISSDGFAKKRGPKGDLESAFQWAHTFPGSLTDVEITPEGYIHAVSRYGKKVKIGKKKGYHKRRFLMKGENVFWKGEAATTAYIGDSPLPIVMESGEEGLVVQAIQTTGQVKWMYILKGIPAAWTVEPSFNTLAFVVMPLGWIKEGADDQEATMVAIDTRDGALRWSVPIGSIKGRLDSFGSEIGINKDGVWWAAGERAAFVDLSSGKVLWSQSIQPTTIPNSLWAFSDSYAAVARGSRLFVFDKSKGPMWDRELRKKSQIGGLLWTEQGLLAKFQDGKGLIISMMDPVTGASRWEHTLKHKFKKYQGPPPNGIVETGNAVIISANGVLHSYDLKSGEEIFQHKMDRKTIWKAQSAVNIRHFRARKNHFVIYGRRTASAFALKDGAPLWQKLGYEPPEDVARRMRDATLQLAFTSFHQLSPTYTSSAASQQAQQARQYSAGSFQHQSFMNAAESLQMSYAYTAGAQQGKSASSWAARIAEVPLELSNRRLPPKYASFYHLRNKKFFAMQNSNKVSAVLMDLDTGEDRHIILPDSGTGCISQVILDPVGNRMFLLYRQLGLACKDENFIESYRL